MLQKIILFNLILFLLASVASPVQAHLLHTDGTIGAVMHLDPEDDPYVGVPSDIFFEIKDTRGVFAPTDCECTLEIRRSDELIATLPIFEGANASDLKHAAVTYTFPSKGIYTLKLIGKSKHTAGFKPFAVSYEIRVARGDAVAPEQSDDKSASTSSSWVLFACIFLALCCTIASVIWIRKKHHGR